MAARRLLVPLLAAAAVLIPVAHAQARAVGVTLDDGPGGPDRSYALFTQAGANAIEAPQPWSELEPRRGRFHLADLDSIVRGVRATPVTEVMVIPAAIETTTRSVPEDLRHVPWDDRRMLHRYAMLIDRIAKLSSGQVTTISIANETDVYLASHPRERPAFLRFARFELARLHRRLPRARIGVTVTAAGLMGDHPRVARALAHLGTAAIVTYYPLGNGYQPRSPHAPLTDIPHLVGLAGGRPLVIQEAGYPTSARLGSSPAAQAAFVRDVFSAWTRQPATAIPFLSFYSLFDLPAQACPGSARSDRLAFLCSLGLHARHGAAKPGWAAFRAGVQSVRAERDTAGA